MRIPATMPDGRMKTASYEAAAKASCREPIDEQRSGHVSAGEAALEHFDIECQIAAGELRGLQDHDSVLDGRAILVEHRDRGIWRILGEAVLPVAPLLDKMFGQDMTRCAHRAVGEYNRIGGNIAQRELVSRKARATRIDHGKRWHHL